MTILGLFSQFSQVLTKPTFENLGVLFRGAILSSGHRTVTECLRSALPWVRKHFSAYENVLCRAKINELKAARIIFELVLRLVPEQSEIELVVDETLVRRYGLYVSGVSMHRDSMRSSRTVNQMTPGNLWVVLALAIRLPFSESVAALPIMSLNYVSPKLGKRRNSGYRKHRTPSELAMLMILIVSRWAPGRRIRLIGDAWYATHEMAALLNEKSKRRPNGSMVSRFQWEARLHADPGEYSGFGRPRIIGERLENPRRMSKRLDARWVLCEVNWYGASRKELMLLSGEGLWYRCGQGATWVRWVVVRDPKGKRSDEVFFTTDRSLSPSEIVECYTRRWCIEVTFEEARRHLGIETLRNRTRSAISRSVPMLFALYSLIVVWFALNRPEEKSPVNVAPWYSKRHVTFSDMLSYARGEILEDCVFQQDAFYTCEFLLAPFPLNIIYDLLADKRKAA